MASKKELLHREKNLMVRYIDAHKENNHKDMSGIQKEMKRNVEQRRDVR